MKKSINRKHSIVLAAILATVLTACGSAPATAATIEDIQPAVEIAQEVAQEVVTEEVVEEVTKAVEEVVEEVVAEPTPEPEPEKIVYEGIDYESDEEGAQWIESFVGIIDEPKVVIFSDITGKKQIVEEDEEVTFDVENDCIGVYLPDGYNMPLAWFDGVQLDLEKDIHIEMHHFYGWLEKSTVGSKTKAGVHLVDEENNDIVFSFTISKE